MPARSLRIAPNQHREAQSARASWSAEIARAPACRAAAWASRPRPRRFESRRTWPRALARIAGAHARTQGGWSRMEDRGRREAWVEAGRHGGGRHGWKRDAMADGGMGGSVTPWRREAWVGRHSGRHGGGWAVSNGAGMGGAGAGTRHEARAGRTGWQRWSGWQRGHEARGP